ncbi:hypothetical protein E3D00_04680 [Swingsia samuiensis]|uniref:Uncharacterized protein n=1 Tax=Swingsia samuiensis TaxID=1293412 RepID=A0A4Y6UKA6_9PROT|nr:hypothetical protein E3D00_04680 [Swingsia samuiensis]
MWYTGSLYAPSPAYPQGSLSLEPYVQVTDPWQRFDSKGRISPAPGQKTLVQYSVVKYGITDRLALNSLPTLTKSWGHGQQATGDQFNDLPLELQYNLIKANPTHYKPSFTVYLGFIAPTGAYRGLAKPQSGVGTGAWFMRFGLQSQSLYNVFGHGARLRVWVQERQPVSSPHLHDITSYGTTTGFEGTAHPGAFGNEGFSLEFGFTKRLVAALDLYGTWSGSNRVDGVYAKTNSRISTHSGWSTSYNIGPALEYSWTPNMGILSGIIIPFSGHNTSRSLMPQVALNLFF